MPDDHVHDCTGPDRRCPCGFVFTVPRYCFTVNVHDNETGITISDHFSSDKLNPIIGALESLLDKLDDTE